MFSNFYKDRTAARRVSPAIALVGVAIIGTPPMASVAVGWHIRENLTIETGYMNQFAWRDSSENISNHPGVVSFKVKFCIPRFQ